MPLRHALALAMAGFLTLSSVLAGPRVLGVVSGAKGVRLNTTSVTTGATVYDGDSFSTEAGGWLQVQSGTVMLALYEASLVSLRNQTNGAQCIEVELSKGRLVFSAALAASLNVVAREARIRPAADTKTVAQISVIGPKELLIRSRRGALQFSYRGETETIAEGTSYRVILDPRNGDSKKEEPVRLPKAFKFVLIGEGAAIVGLGIYELRESESPDRP